MVYVPWDPKLGSKSLRYDFVNFLSCEVARAFMESFTGFCQWEMPTQQPANVKWSSRQGFHKNFQHYKNKVIMKKSVPDIFKQAVFSAGTRVPFPGSERL